MNTNPGDHWRGPGGPSQTEGPSQGRAFGGFGPNGPSQASHVLPPPPPSSYHGHHSQPSASHSLSIADLTQGPQNQHQYNTQPPPPSQTHPMSSLGHPHLPQHSPPYLSRDREMMERREREMREQELRERGVRERSNMEMQRHQEELMMREREARERDRQQMERMHREQQEQRPVQSHAGSIPIHQPVANKVQNQIHGPNGLLSNGGAGPIQQNGPSGASNLYGTSAPEQPRSQFIHQQVAPPSQPPAPTFIAGPSPLPAQAQLASGQQPILNDALSYLDQVKVRFSDQPDVYNRFLDIMKDFKSQAIDTPGVIDRVSELFQGHPALIQGFNTFLPPGYRIECGTDENPDAIRVTTPSGTMTQSLQNRARAFESSSLNPANQSSMNRQDTFDDAVTTMQQQEQRGVSSLQSAVSAASNGVARAVMAGSPTPAQQVAYAQQGGFGAADLKRGGPVEFNHAISYVNKIKNRFNQQPEIYKQFLEILQTYQRESKPIQDVYAQVTQLFHSAPDLLEDFKQFLPETAAQAKAQASMRVAANEELSNVRGEPGYGALPQAQTPRPAAKMPPMGQFDPPSTSKDNKKRRGVPGGTMQSTSNLDSALSQGRAMPVQVGNTNKRQKLTTQRQMQPEAIVTSPTLIPQLPEPLPPYPSIQTTQEELGFFDRAKKQIGNRASYAEFLKLINLYTQDLIDKYTLADRVVSFIGSNPELMSFFRDFLGITEQEEVIEARARPELGRVNLSHCRALGPSYRHLPKRDQNKTCKGRDGMCYQVLNDVWASHPTWASEDTGFVAHRKNQYEEALHRIEEERHDYDFHIESCQRTIQLMEPLVQQISVMNDADRAAFQLAPGLGGASEAIPKRIIMKIYGRDVGARVLTEMFQRPTAVLPIVLSRLKQKLEEWKATQREWEKVWRDQINKQFWKSLDHQGINAKNMDKKNFQHKTLTSEIQAKYEEGKKNRENGVVGKKHQLQYSFDNVEVIVDATRLVLTCLESERNGYNGGEMERIRLWFLDFIPRFFGLNADQFADQVRIEVPGSRDEEIQDGIDSDSPSGMKSKASKTNLLRKALDKRSGKDDSASASKESTPVPTTEHDMEIDEEPSQSDGTESTKQPWINHVDGDLRAQQVSLEDTYPHVTFNLYANANIYCFFRLFQMLYARLLAIKENEQNVVDAIARFKGADGRKKAAIELRMIDRSPEDFFTSVTSKSPDHFYTEILRMCEDVVTGSGELSHLEETLRRFYNKSGWQLYTVDKLVGATLRFIMSILGGDAKDKSVEITNLFFRDREKPDTTRRQEIQYRKTVERFCKDGEVYRISYTPDAKLCTIRLFPSEEPTFDSDALSHDQLWQYYIASYTMSEATEGVDQSSIRMPFLRRNIAPQNSNLDAAAAEVYGNVEHFDNQAAFISPDTYKLLLSNDFIFWRTKVGQRNKYDTAGSTKERKLQENEAFREKFVRNTTWMKDQQPEDVGRRKMAWGAALKANLYGFEDALV